MTIVLLHTHFQNDTVFSLLSFVKYALSSLFLYYILLFVGVDRLTMKQKIFFALPLIVDVFLALLSLKTQWYYYIKVDGLPGRGPLYFFHAFIDFLYACFIPYFTIKSTIKSHILRETIEPLLFFIVPFAAYDLNVYHSSVSIFWALIAWSLLFYYLFLIDKQFKFDALTKVRNRTAFNVRMTLLDKSKKNSCLVVFDLNNLKQINDQYGHAVGDHRLQIAASFIESVFAPYGIVYRIGGDEFCVIGKMLCDKSLLTLLQDLNALIEERNTHLEFAQISIASGFSWYSKHISALQGFEMADTAMYHNKITMKKNQAVSI